MDSEHEPVISIRESSPSDGEFVAARDGRQVGRLTYSRRDPSTLVIEYVFVVPEARGGIVGRALVDAAAAFARAHALRVASSCGYSRMGLRRHHGVTA